MDEEYAYVRELCLFPWVKEIYERDWSEMSGGCSEQDGTRILRQEQNACEEIDEEKTAL